MSTLCCAIDVHTHVVPAHLPDERPEFAGLPWPSIRHTDACHAQVIISGKNFRDINDACWSVPRRTEQMPGMDVGVQVLSPMRPSGMDRLVGPANLEQVVAFPCETALSIASVITGGLMKRHPRLRLGFSHGGGAFGQVLPRMQHAWSAMAPIKAAMDEPRAVARRLFYDTLVYDETALHFLVDSFGTSQLMIGSDYPFPIMDRQPTGRAQNLGLTEADLDGILFGNTRRFLGLG